MAIVANDDDVNTDSAAAALVGLTVAWGGVVLLLSPADRLLGPPERLTTRVLEQLAMWVLLGLVLVIVAFWERQPLSSIGLGPPRWSSIGWGLLLSAVTIGIMMPVLTWLLRVAGLPGFEAGIAKVVVLPVWFRLLAVVTAGTVEDALFIGYAFTRLERLTGRSWLAAVIAVAVTALLHLPHWGIGPVLTYFIAVGVAVAFFAWRRDLLANIVAHVTVDAMGLVIVPLLS